ncbi:MAG: PRC-barrel domain-containing protein [Coriobacteriales bacterium]|nr:PRC-barrel domain-containing protein [Coriobacteriales bacterium]
MRKVSEYSGKPVYVPKKGKTTAYERLGKVHMAVFSPKGKRIVGFLVKRPDIAGMIKRPDTFVALDAISKVDGGYRVSGDETSFDEKARKRLQLDWDHCIMWSGMDAKTTKGKVLGYVSDAVFNETTGAVESFLIGDGGMAESLVGLVQVPASMLVGYEKGFMILTPEAAEQKLTGGLAAKAGEASARAKAEGAKAAEKAGKAVDKGSKALGRQLGKTKGMFGAFVDEFKKASE